MLRSVAVRPLQGIGQPCLWAPMGCTLAVMALLHLRSARASADKGHGGLQSRASGLEKAQDEATPGTWLLPGPSFRAFLSKEEQQRNEGNKPAQQ